jgi:hypothetical protein
MKRSTSPKLMALAAAALTALGVGGAAAAQSNNPAPAQAQHQSADRPDAPDGHADAPDRGETGSEKPGGDGPGGHADENGGDPDHQAGGQEQ